MLSKSIACWLIALVVAPFTAPFPTCDVMSLFGRPNQHTPLANVPHARVQVRATRSRRRTEHGDDGAVDAPMASMHAEPLRVPDSPPVSTQLSTDEQFPSPSLGAIAGRLRLLLLTRVGSAGNNNNLLSLSTAARRTVASLNRPSGFAIVATILRV